MAYGYYDEIALPKLVYFVCILHCAWPENLPWFVYGLWSRFHGLSGNRLWLTWTFPCWGPYTDWLHAFKGSTDALAGQSSKCSFCVGVSVAVCQCLFVYKLQIYLLEACCLMKLVILLTVIFLWIYLFVVVKSFSLRKVV